MIMYEIAHKDSNILVVETADFDYKGDKIHFSTESLRKMGKIYAEKYHPMSSKNRNN